MNQKKYIHSLQSWYLIFNRNVNSKDIFFFQNVVMTSRKPTQDLAIQVVQDNAEFFTNDKEKTYLQESVPWLCLDLKNWSKFWQFVILSISVFFFYLVSTNYFYPSL